MVKLKHIALIGAGLFLLSRVSKGSTSPPSPQTSTSSLIGNIIGASPDAYARVDYPSGAALEAYTSAGEDFLRFIPAQEIVRTAENISYQAAKAIEGQFIITDIQEHWTNIGGNPNAARGYYPQFGVKNTITGESGYFGLNYNRSTGNWVEPFQQPNVLNQSYDYWRSYFGI